MGAPINFVDLVDKTQDEACMLLECIFKALERKSQGYPGGKTTVKSKPQNDLPDSSASENTAFDIGCRRITCRTAKRGNGQFADKEKGESNKV